MIRMAQVSDVPAMLQIYAPYITDTTYSFEYTVPTQEAFTQRFQSISRDFPWLVWEEEGRVLGYAYGSLPFERAAYAWCGEVSIYLAPEAWGRGVGRRLYGALEALMAQQGYRKVYALVTTENAGSMAFHQKVGYHIRATFEDCGFKHGRWLGVVWLEKQLLLQDRPEQMPEPWHAFSEKKSNFEAIVNILALF